MKKIYQDINVFDAAKNRIRKVFTDFEQVYVSFSGGKDSSAMLQLTIEVAKEIGKLPVNVLVIDMEAQYTNTIKFIERMANKPEVNMFWVCLPIHLRNAVSQHQTHWICWDEEAKDRWVRPLPKHKSVISDVNYFPFFRKGMEFEEFVPLFGEWFAKDKLTACMVGIRSDESLNRFRTIVSDKKVRWDNQCWTTKINDNLYNAYPIYDWRSEDVWTAHGKQKWDHNKTYDLMHLAGVPIHQQRLCQPFGDDQRSGLWLYQILEPDTWALLVSRVAGANFGGRYANKSGNVLGNNYIKLPEGYTWQSYSEFLLDSMPPPLAEHYREKINKFLDWWDKNGSKYGFETVPDFADPKLEAAKKAPSYRRICKVLLKNDYWCKGLSFSQTKREMEKRLDLISRFIQI